MNVHQGAVCFFIGTEAELIKLFPVIIEIQNRKINYRIISSGQNDISKSSVLKVINNGWIDATLSDYFRINKSPLGLLRWFITTSMSAVKILKEQFQGLNFKNSIMVVHGDTVSTVMGARLGTKLGMRVAHIEAGLRSRDIFNPFPEELDRMLTSHYSRIHFAPGDDAMKNLVNAKGEKINTTHNTIYDSLKFSQTVKTGNPTTDFLRFKYFVFVLHRQENLANKEFVRAVLDKVIESSEIMQCIMIMHKPTEVALQSMGFLKNLIGVKTINCIPRMEYFDFMKLLANAKFVITDGGSNQEELSYLGKPCFILRKKTERNNGIGKNVILYDGDIMKIERFVSDYKLYERPALSSDISPSKIIADKLEGCFNG